MILNLRPVLVASFRRHVRLLAAGGVYCLFAGLALSLAPTRVLAQAPLGQDFQINQTILGYQWYPEISAVSSGFTVVWDQDMVGPPDPSGGDAFLAIMTRGLSPSGTPLGAELPAAGPDRSYKLHSHVGAAPNGNRLVVWGEDGNQSQPLNRGEVFGRLYDAAGNVIFEKRRINGHELGDQIPHAVAADGNSNFIVVWESQPFESALGSVASQDGSGDAVYARRISSSGEFLGPEFRVNTYTRGDQWPDSVAAAPDGKFVVVWTSVEQDGSGGGVYGQLFGANGKRIGSEFRVNQYTTGWQFLSDVAMDRWGNFVVVWQSQFQDGSLDGVYARRYRSDGRPREREWRVKSDPLGIQETPRVAMDSAGNFVVVWNDSNSGPAWPDPMARAFRANGKPVGKEFIVNSGGVGEQELPDVAISDNGTMVVVWQDWGDETPPNVDNGTGVFGRRFVTPFPSRCVPSETTLCLEGGRFRVEANWSYPLGEDLQAHGPGKAVALREHTGAFSFFEPTNLELLVKVADGCRVNGHFWLLAGGLTSVGVELTVVDTATGEIRVYRNPAGTPFQPVQDKSAFAGCEVEADSQRAPSAFERSAASPAVCSPDAKRLCLGDGRYEVTATWRRRDGSAGVAEAVPITGDTGAFWFFDDDDIELLVKVIGGCSVNGHSWVFAGGITDLEVSLTVHDRVTGEEQTYHNPADIPFQPLQDTQRFSCQ